MSVMTKPSVGRNAISDAFDWRRGLLLGGAAAALLYILMDTTAALLYDGYSYRDQTISELSAIDAPARPYWVPLGFVFSFLIIATGYGVWHVASGRTLRVMAALIVLVGVLGFVGWPFAPMHQREVLASGGGNFGDTLHLILGGVNSVIFMVLQALGITFGSKRFRIYSALTLLAVIGFGAYMGTQTPNVGENEPTPWLGIAERIAIFASMIWMGVLGLTLWLRDSKTDRVR
jgi:hypothetical protein